MNQLCGYFEEILCLYLWEHLYTPEVFYNCLQRYIYTHTHTLWFFLDILRMRYKQISAYFLIRSFVFYCCYYCYYYCNAEDETPGLVHMRRLLWYWAISPVLLIAFILREDLTCPSWLWTLILLLFHQAYWFFLERFKVYSENKSLTHMCNKNIRSVIRSFIF